MSTFYAENLHDLILYNDIPNGVHTYSCTKNNISITFEIVNYVDDKQFTTNEQIGNTVADSQMLILKFNRNCTINSGVTITPSVRKKGMVIFCRGTITNNGKISMTARGASAAGQDVYLYENEYVPAIGASGGASYTGTGVISGRAGSAGTGRRTGGGGTGGCRLDGHGTLGSGGNGTSYSGGSGGGAVIHDIGGSGTSGSGSNTGGAGGNGQRSGSGSWAAYASGGVGNPGGSAGVKGCTSIVNNSGTGGLLVIYANEIINNGTLESKGVDSNVVNLGGSTLNAGGGASGGGSINVFTYINFSTTRYSVAGGLSNTGSATTRYLGGNGGNGCFTISRLKDSPAGYEIITDKCSSNVKYVRGGETIRITAKDRLTVNGYLCEFARFVCSDKEIFKTGEYNSKTNTLKLEIPEGIDKDITIEAIFYKLRTNSNFYRDSLVHESFDFSKILGGDL